MSALGSVLAFGARLGRALIRDFIGAPSQPAKVAALPKAGSGEGGRPEPAPRPGLGARIRGGLAAEVNGGFVGEIEQAVRNAAAWPEDRR